ncbi:hypothetical protein SAMN04244547_03948 [Azotobacter vinelandii]|nr:hypothetical protein SAMN04244547_03948 [Azotobacter vinelandii]
MESDPEGSLMTLRSKAIRLPSGEGKRVGRNTMRPLDHDAPNLLEPYVPLNS